MDDREPKPQIKPLTDDEKLVRREMQIRINRLIGDGWSPEDATRRVTGKAIPFSQVR